jgi:hypothetical protein
MGYNRSGEAVQPPHVFKENLGGILRRDHLVAGYKISELSQAIDHDHYRIVSPGTLAV